MNYSVLMTVYHKEKPEFFSEAIKSILNQTFKTNDFVIVCDGPLTNDLEQVLNDFKSYKCVNIVRLKENKGSGFAAQQGLLKCKNNIVLRMDSDDVSLPDRAHKQIEKIKDGYDFVGGYITEFDTNPNEPFATKIMPTEKDKIIKYSKKRNPFCNVTTCFKKDVVLNLGGYSDQLYLEDYTLGVKIIQSGANFTNIPYVLVNVRSNRDQIVRRSDKKLRKYFKELRKYMLKTGYINHFQYIIYNVETTIFCISPKWIKKLFYKIFLRGKK